jgi:hypothetical protein
MLASSTSSTQVRIDSQFMFSTHKNVHKKGIEKQQRKLLQKVSFITAFLAPDEKVLLIVPCVSPTSFWGQYTTGWMHILLYRALLIVTNKGIFHVPTKMNYDYRQSIAKFRYEDCKDIYVRGTYLYAQYANGDEDRFLYLPRAQRLKLKAYLSTVVMGGSGAANIPRAYLCPRCTKPLSPNVYKCPACQLAFRDMGTAVKKSILMPGGGYFYTGHPFLGIADFIVELTLLAFVITQAIAAVQGAPGAAFSAVFFAVILAIEKLITVHHAKRYIAEYIPMEKSIQLASKAA